MFHPNTEGFATVAVILVVAVVVGVGSVLLVKKDDQPIEEVSEFVIEKELGLPQGSVDLTPGSHE